MYSRQQECIYWRSYGMVNITTAITTATVQMWNSTIYVWNWRLKKVRIGMSIIFQLNLTLGTVMSIRMWFQEFWTPRIKMNSVLVSRATRAMILSWWWKTSWPLSESVLLSDIINFFFLIFLVIWSNR